MSKIIGSVSALLLLSSGLVAPAASAIIPGSASSAPASWIDCDIEFFLDCPDSPEITSFTSETSKIHVSWAWPGETQISADITQLVVRVSPSELEVVVAPTESTISIAELDPKTEYSVTVLAISGLQLGVPSSPVTVVTLPATLDGDPSQSSAGEKEGDALKPQASSGDIDGLIVTLKDDSTTESVAANAASDLPVAGVTVEETQDLGAGNAKIELSQGVSRSDAQAMIVDLESDPRVESVELDQRVYLNVFPNDPPNDTKWVSNSLWGLYGSNGAGFASDKSTMNSIWTRTQGSGTVVAVLDTGSSVHPDLDANYVDGYDFVSAGSASCRTDSSVNSDGDYVNTGTYGALGWDNNPLDPGDWVNVNSSSCTSRNSSWHGTHVAGTIAAVANNNQYITGVAPESEIQPIRVLSMDGGLTSDITAAITWASGGAVGGHPNNSTPADVINLSLGGLGSCSSAWQTAIDAAVARGSVVVVAAGNDNQDASNFVPANCNNVITVAALESGGARSSFSNFGSTVEIAAPGSGIYSTVNTGTTEPVSGSGGPGVASLNGTSMAAPHVAGVAALLKSSDNTLTPANILARLTATAKKFPTGTGRDCSTSTCGAGMLQASGVSLLHVSSVSPTTGSTAGGTSVTLGGWKLASPSSVTFGGITGTVTASSETSITVTTPAVSAGAVDVVVTTSAGSFTTASGFTFTAPPPAAAAAPAAAPLPAAAAAAAPEKISVSEPVVTSNQVSGAGEFRAVDKSGVPIALRSAGLIPSGFAIEGSGWEIAGSGALNSTQQTLKTGDPITISGEGLQRLTTVGIYVLSEPTWVGSGIVSNENDFTASFGIPALPPGQHTLQINIVLPGGVKNSLAIGFTAVGAPVATPQTPETVIPLNLGNIVGFSSRSAKLSKPAKAKLEKMAASVKGANTSGSITTYYNKRGTAKSKSLATARAKSIKKFLAKMGVSESLSIARESGRTAKLRRSAIIRLSTQSQTTALVKNRRISSLIVRYAKGVSPTVNGAVRGANLVVGRVGEGMTLGPNLGLRMYRVDLAQPVSFAAARRVSARISTHKAVEFAEPDRMLTSSITAR